jgi:tripartite-type tricarboxylate transporter receptor subunit TctC
VLLALAGAHPAIHAADSYPQRPIRFLIPQSPGGASDTVGRIVAQKLGERVGQQLVVDNRPGATGNIGHELVARASPDGYTMLLTAPNLVTSPSLFAKLGYDPLRDFAPITQLTLSPNVWLVHPAFPARNMQELIAIARSKPGKIDFASSGLASTQHLAGELLNVMAGIQLAHVPYKGGGPALIDLMAGARRDVRRCRQQSRTSRCRRATHAGKTAALPIYRRRSAIAGYGSTWQGLCSHRRRRAVSHSQRGSRYGIGQPTCASA